MVIVLTDGANTYSTVSDSGYANNRSTYAAYGYTGLTYPGSGSVTRLFMNTSTDIGKTTYTGATTPPLWTSRCRPFAPTRRVRTFSS